MNRGGEQMRKILVAVAIGAGTVFALTPASAGAATITPTAGQFGDSFIGGDAVCSLRDAVSVATTNSAATRPECSVSGTLGGDQVLLGAGTYTLSLTNVTEGAAGDPAANDLELITPGSGSLTIFGQGAASTTITAAPGWPDRIMEAHPGGEVGLGNLTVSGGNDTLGRGADGGGALRSEGFTNLSNARITGNRTVGRGGGIEYLAATSFITVNASAISENDSGDNGGGLAISGADSIALIDDSAITGNVATKTSPRGGGLFVTDAALEIENTAISANHATEPTATGTPAGGGVRIEGGAATMLDVTVSGNEVDGGLAASGNANAQHGAGISSVDSSLTAVSTTISDNVADGEGGYGGGLHVGGSDVSLSSSTVAGNAIGAGESGSAIFHSIGSATVRDSILAAQAGASVCAGTILSGGSNVIGDASCVPETNGDVHADPELGALADEGGAPEGPTEYGTQVGPTGFRQPLLTRSPAVTSAAIDHVPDACTEGEDARGANRHFDGDGDSIALCDSGATEVYPCLGAPANRIGNPTVDVIPGTGADDVVLARGGNDQIDAGAGNDRICGGDGNDTLRPGSGDDQLDGGANMPPIAGGDFADFSNSAAAVTASIVGNSASGDGTDSFVPGTIENLLGSPQGDTLAGDAGPNLIGGLAGDDRINGLGGDDGLDGNTGHADEVLFTGAPGPVEAELEVEEIINDQGAATGFGNDILFDLEQMTGGAFGDTLTGNTADNLLRGAGGADTLAGLAGADDFQAQDGVSDTVDCTGGGGDTGSFDASPLETFLGCGDNADGDGLPDLFDACSAVAGTLANGCPAPPSTTAPAGQALAPTTKCKKGFKLKKVKTKGGKTKKKCVRKRKKK